MLRNIKLIHFKCFEQLELNCKQLNLLCGLNGMGKSSVIQALLMLRQSFETGELLAGRLTLNGERVAVGTGADVLFEDAEHDVLEFVLESDEIETPWEIEFDCHRTSMADILDSSSSRTTATKRQLDNFLKKLPDKDHSYVPSEWRDMPPFGGELVYINAERVGSRQLYPVSTDVLTRRGDFGESGEYAWDHLNRHQNDLLQTDDPRCVEGSDRPLFTVVDHWLQEVCPGAHLQLEEVRAADAVIAGFTFDFPSDLIWDSSLIGVDFYELKDDESGEVSEEETFEEIDNLARSDHASPIYERHRQSFRGQITSYAELWNNRKLAFPNLLFGPDIEDHLKKLNTSKLGSIVGKLANLNAAAAEWPNVGGSAPPWKARAKVVNESESLQNNAKLRERRRFKSYDGTRQLFLWHARFSDSGRIHLRFDPSSHEIEIGYIGKHLPLP